MLTGICLYTAYTLCDTSEQTVLVQTEGGLSRTRRESFPCHTARLLQPGSWGSSEDRQASAVTTPSAPNGCSEDGVVSPNVSVLLGDKGCVDTRCYYFLSKSRFLDWWIGLIGPPLCSAQCPFKQRAILENMSGKTQPASHSSHHSSTST